MLAAPMASAAAQAILQIAEKASPNGVAMGTIVDRLESEGFSAAEIETEIWRLLELRQLTPCGFVCRTLRRHDRDGHRRQMRVYEFMLVPWSIGLDQQLELGLNGSRG